MSRVIVGLLFFVAGFSMSAIQNGDLKGSMNAIKLVTFLNGMPIFSAKEISVDVNVNTIALTASFDATLNSSNTANAKRLSIKLQGISVPGMVDVGEDSLQFTASNTLSNWDYYDVNIAGGISFTGGWYSTGETWRLRSLTCYPNGNVNTDGDNDGIRDCNEQPGVSPNDLSFYDWGARVGQRDIFVQIDYMADPVGRSDAGLRPRREALEKVADSFKKEGYGIHFDVGDLYHQAPGLSPEDFDLGGGSEIPFVQTSTLNDVRNRRANLLAEERGRFFYYMVFASSQNADGSAGSSGRAQINGLNSLITLGNWKLNDRNTVSKNILINYQAGTIMHEFGHNLGLRHGGFENRNYKPNYNSIMNYLYQLSGVAEDNASQGDRYFANLFANNADCGSYNRNNVANSRTSSTFIVDYSNGSRSRINEEKISESNGLGSSPAFAVDLNCDGSIDSGNYSADLNSDDKRTDLSDYNDWANINLVLSGRHHPLWARTLSAPEVAEEEQPSDEFFESLERAME